MNTSVTSKEAILESCRQLVSEKGISSLNMRAVAQACGVALGSVYYYFPSKNDLLISTIESVWEDIFRWKDADEAEVSFPAYIERVYAYVQGGIQKYPNFFTIHSISLSAKGQNMARETMTNYFDQMKSRMLKTLQADKEIREEAFSESFTQLDFVDFILSNMICLLVEGQKTSKTLIEVIRRAIY